MPTRTFTTTTIARAVKAASGRAFPGKSHSEYLDGQTPAPAGNVIAGAFPAFTGSSISNMDAGFNVPAESADTIKYYVDPASGSDSNDGLSPATAKATYGAATSLARSGFPDHVYLKRGSTYLDINFDSMPSGRSTTEPSVIGFYGSAADGGRPAVILTSDMWMYQSREFVRIVGIKPYCINLDPFNDSFKQVKYDRDNRSNVAHGSVRFHALYSRDIWFIDCDFEYAELLVELNNNASTEPPGPIYLHRCIMHGAYNGITSFSSGSRPSCMYISKGDGFYLSECVLSDGGWNPYVAGAAANMFCHNAYWQYDNVGNHMEFVDCISMNPAAHGCQLRSGGLISNSLFLRCSVAITIGNTQDLQPSGTRAHVYNNVCLEGRSMHVGKASCVGSVCTTALFGLDVKPNVRTTDLSDYQVHGNIVNGLAPLSVDPWQPNANKQSHHSELTAENSSQNHYYKFNSETQGTTQGYSDPDRSISTYLTSIGKPGTTEDFMRTVRERNLGEWSAEFTAPAVNDYIRIGFDQAKVPYTWTEAA